MWKVSDVEIPCVGAGKIDVIFSGFESQLNGETGIPAEQFETFIYVSRLPNTFFEQQSQTLRKLCLEMLTSKNEQLDSQINVFRIEDHFKITELILLAETSQFLHKFAFNCQCDWCAWGGIRLICHNEKLVKVTELRS